MGPYFDPDFDGQLERIPPPRVCVDNDTCEDCTLVKVDSANRHGILLEMVQVLTDLDLIISKSYISSDVGWLMDVFHVTDQLGNKIIDKALIQYIEQSLDARKKEKGEVITCLGNMVGSGLLASEYTMLEVTATDEPGLLSEIAAVLTELHRYKIISCRAWTHNSHVAIIMYLVDEATGKPILDPDSLAHIEEQVEVVLGAHFGEEETRRRRVKVSGPLAEGRVHTERRLHQLMHEDRDYEAGPPPVQLELGGQFGTRAALIQARKGWLSSLSLNSPLQSPSAAMQAQVSIDRWIDRGYSVVNVRSMDRPKLLFDTVCTLTDMQYVVFHAAVSSHGLLAIQEYYIRHKDDNTILDKEAERQRVTRCLVAAIERRVSHGLRVVVSTRNRRGLLAEVTRILRESGLSLTRAECALRGERAIGTFFVMDASSTGGGEVDPKRVEAALRDEMNGGIQLDVSNTHPRWSPIKMINHGNDQPVVAKGRSSIGFFTDSSTSSTSSDQEDERPRFSLGSLLWSHIERFSSNFGSIRS
ncbi:ACT domain-containing protein ACR3 [Iris pallida]|uniref:ACT domain-containing protein ACR n=1 Tax=Iris pallida TaxID=29817 RepID=A0AAX6HMT9_IRIPA|nr:ACT domain-containing protein ACR3 [Iris pallida]